ncbi:hypothetical protein [Iningainema tapete]|uniref:Uncharacterized protein n=1 Tax=Iningainema tapete BLCC-T55 TaxID=2748662 RepID=A0A8J6XKQ4_9CYAN|nr:hypothetical protein [Iningainema tapete]MBD2774777.1 hypothetical protein [Iningainema tapete BLCC-T55]
MNKRFLSKAIFVLSIPTFSAFPTIPSVAQESTPQQNQEVTIPKSSAITISFPTPVTFNAGQKKSLPTAALLAHPILDSNGNVVAPPSSPVSIELQPFDGGAKIVAQSVVIGGRVIPITASSPLIPGKTVTIASGAQLAQENQYFYRNLVGSVFGVFGSANRASNDIITNLTNFGNTVGTGIGILTGLSSPKTTRQVEITSGSMYVLTLQAPVTLPASVVITAPPTQKIAPAQS